MVQWLIRHGLMLYGLIAEDTFILRAVPVLISRSVDLDQQPPECRLMNGKPDFLANFWRPVKEFQYRYPHMHKVLAVCDADRESPVELLTLLTSRAQNRLLGLPFPLVFHVIKRELETWWIGESQAISTVTGVNIPFPGGNVEESIQDPKEYIIQRLSRAKRPYTRDDAEAVARQIDFGMLSSRSPGFAQFTAKVENGRVGST